MAFYGATTLTWAQAKARVADVAGSRGDSDQLVQAGYALEEAILEWESRRDWKYTLDDGTADITLVANTTDYNLDTTFKKMYNVRLLTNGRVLLPVDRRTYDLVIPQQTGLTSAMPTHYSLALAQGASPAIIKLLPGCGIADTMRLVFYRKHTIPAEITAGTTGDDSDAFDFQHRFMPALLAMARTIFLANKGGETARLEYWMRKAEDLFGKAVREDEWEPDSVIGFSPDITGRSSSAAPNDVSQYLSDW